MNFVTIFQNKIQDGGQMADQHILAHNLTSTAAITLIFGRIVDNDVLDLNPRLGEEILSRIPRQIQDGGQMTD